MLQTTTVAARFYARARLGEQAAFFTEGAVTHHLRNGFDHRTVHMAVVVFPQEAAATKQLAV